MALCRKTVLDVLSKIKQLPDQKCECFDHSCYAILVKGESRHYWNLACWDKVEKKVCHKLCESA